jgi:hypothetical protein
VWTPVVSIPLIAAIAWPLYGGGFVNYDAMWSLVWGDEIARLHQPSFGAALAPTPHPLSNLVGVALAPFGANADTALHLIGYLTVGALVYATALVAYRLFGVVAAIAAGALILTRTTLATYGALAYLDVAFAALVVWAIALEARQRRHGWPTLALLSVAGLLRPEAWFIAGGYWVWLAHKRDRRTLLRLAPFVAAPPVAWVVMDFVVTGEPLFSFTHTRTAAAGYHRVVGVGGLIEHGPRVLGQELRPAVLVAAVLGFGLSVFLARSRFMLAWTLAAGAAFCVPVAAGTPLNARYLLPVIALGCVAAAGALTGWARTGGRRRTLWTSAAVVSGVLLIATAPAQERRLREQRDHVERVAARRNDARDVLRAGLPCLPVAVSHPFLTPLVALWTRTDVDAIRPTRASADALAGTVLWSTSEAIAGLAPAAPAPGPQDDTHVIRRSGGWSLSARCGDSRRH